MSKLHKKRLLKLIAFLKTLSKKKFNFWNGNPASKKECGSAVCVIGWTTVVFPSLVKKSGYCGYPFLVDGRIMRYVEVGEHLFGLSEEMSERLFTPDSQGGIHSKMPVCTDRNTPKQVASMLEKFLKLVEAGEIET